MVRLLFCFFVCLFVCLFVVFCCFVLFFLFCFFFFCWFFCFVFFFFFSKFAVQRRCLNYHFIIQDDKNTSHSLNYHLCGVSEHWFGLVFRHINHCWSFNTKPGLFIYIRYLWFIIMSTKLNGCKYFYVSLGIQLNILYLFTVRWSNSSIQTIQFCMSFVCTQFKCQTVLFDPEIGPYQGLPLQARVDVGAIAMKGYSIFP